MRAQILNDGPPRVSGHIAYRAVLPIDAVPEAWRPNSVVLWGGPSTTSSTIRADRVAAADGDFAAAFEAYQQSRYLRTGRVQLTARYYGEAYYASGVTAELRNMMLGNRKPDQAFEGLGWLYDGI